VAGGLVAVSPSQFGIGLFSPRLDERGNSVRAVEASRAISERFSLHLMHQVERTGPSFMRVAEDGTEEPVPPGPVRHVVADVPVLSLQGYIEFAAAEQAIMAVRSRVGDEDLPHAIVLDLDHVTRCHPVAALLFDSIVGQLAGRGVPVVTVDRQARGMIASSAEFATRAEAVAGARGG